MSISRVVTLRVLPGRVDDFMQRLSEGKKLRESAGFNVTFYRTVAGPESRAVLIITTADDWPQFAEITAKLQADPAWQAFDRQLTNDPVAEELSTSIIQDFTLP